MRDDLKGRLTEGLGIKICYRELDELIHDGELTEAEREQFDYLPWDRIDAGEDSAMFFRRERDGNLYCLDQFMRTEPGGDLARFGYHGFAADSFSSGIAIHLDPDGDHVISALVLA